MGFIDSRHSPVVEHSEQTTVHNERQLRSAINRTRRELDEMGVDPDKIRSEVKHLERSFRRRVKQWRKKEAARNG